MCMVRTPYANALNKVRLRNSNDNDQRRTVGTKRYHFHYKFELINRQSSFIHIHVIKNKMRICVRRHSATIQ